MASGWTLGGVRQSGRDPAELPLARAAVEIWGGLAETLGDVVDKGLQLFGGAGYMNEYPITRMYADARVMRIFAGSNEISQVGDRIQPRLDDAVEQVDGVRPPAQRLAVDLEEQLLVRPHRRVGQPFPEPAALLDG